MTTNSETVSLIFGNAEDAYGVIDSAGAGHLTVTDDTRMTVTIDLTPAMSVNII